MSMAESMIGSSFESLREGLNPTAFSLDSMQGVVFLLVCLFLFYKMGKHTAKFLGWVVRMAILFQIGYVLGRSCLNEYIPFATIFKYDLMTSLAQLCVGTKLCDLLLWINAFFTEAVVNAFDYSIQILEWVWGILRNLTGIQ